MKNPLVIAAIVALIAGGAGFYGGTRYQKSKTPTFGNGRFPAASQGMNRTRTGNPMQNGMQPINGQIMSVDDTGITVKMPDGSSKIVIISGSTKIVKSTEADKTVLMVGESVTAFGTTNPDGSVSAQNILLGNLMFRGVPGQNPSVTPSPTQ